MALARAIGSRAAMNETLEQHVEALEKQVAEMREQLAKLKPREKDWTKSFGIFANDPDHDLAVKLGREWRESQTYEKEIAAQEAEARAQGK